MFVSPNLPPLPEEISLKIFSHLDFADLSVCCRVSKQWQRIASDNSLWKPLVAHIPHPPFCQIKSFLDQHAVKKQEQLPEKLYDYLMRMQIGCRGSFFCYFSHHPQYGISAYSEVQKQRGKETRKKDDQIWIYTKKIREKEPSIHKQCITIDKPYLYYHQQYNIRLPSKIYAMVCCDLLTTWSSAMEELCLEQFFQREIQDLSKQIFAPCAAFICVAICINILMQQTL